jgi:hypothetical protein
MANNKGWRDITSYSQGDTTRTPRTFEMMAGRMRLVVTRHRDIEPTDWQMEMQGVFITTLRGDRTAAFAKANCLMLARGYLRDAMNAITLEMETGSASEFVWDGTTPKVRTEK